MQNDNQKFGTPENPFEEQQKELLRQLGEIQYYIEVNEHSLKQLYQQKQQVLQQLQGAGK